MKWWHWLLIGTGAYFLFFRKAAVSPAVAATSLTTAPATTEPQAQATAQAIYAMTEQLAAKLRAAGAMAATDTVTATITSAGIDFYGIIGGKTTAQPLMRAKDVADFNAQLAKL